MSDWRMNGGKWEDEWEDEWVEGKMVRQMVGREMQ